MDLAIWEREYQLQPEVGGVNGVNTFWKPGKLGVGLCPLGIRHWRLLCHCVVAVAKSK